MTIRDQAVNEMKLVNFPSDEIAAMKMILDIFFDVWDSGGAVSVMAPVLQRLIAGKPLSPIEDEEDQWVEVDVDPVDRETTYQHRRCSSVFKVTSDFPTICYDIAAGDDRAPITFPYYPERAEVASPVIAVETK
jgi:hypothetical protein